MMNEFKEYEEYSATIDENWKPESGRLKYIDFIKNNFSGLYRALLLVARANMIIIDGRLTNEKDVRDSLLAWCGFTRDGDGWMMNYFFYNFFRQISLECSNCFREAGETEIADELKGIDSLYNYDDVIKIINKAEGSIDEKKTRDILKRMCIIVNAAKKYLAKRNQFEMKLFSESYSNTNSRNKITYDRIIAEAFAEGPLKRYYLVALKDPFANNNIIVYKTRRKSSKLRDKQKNIILKTTAAFLLNKLIDNQKSVGLSKVDIANWCGLSKAESLKFDEFFLRQGETDSDEKIFISQKIDNFIVVSVNEKWIENFKIVEETQLDDILKDNGSAIFFSDMGSREDLMKNINTRYQ